MPSLFLKGQKDILLSQENFAQLHDVSNQSEMHILGGLGHLAFMQSPELIAKIISDFVFNTVENSDVESQTNKYT